MSNRNSLSCRRRLSLPPISTMTEVSVDELLERYLNEQDVIINMNGPDHVDASVQNNIGSVTTNSIPARLRSFYSHASFRHIILSLLSLVSICLAFLALFIDKVDSCSALGFVTSIILLFAPSPLTRVT